MEADKDESGASPDEADFGAIMRLMTSKYTAELVDRHVAAVSKVCKTCRHGFLLKHMSQLSVLLRLVVDRFAGGQREFAPVICDFMRVASHPFVSCKSSDMITYGHELPTFLKTLMAVLPHSLPPVDEEAAAPTSPSAPGAEEAEMRRQELEVRRTMNERIRIELAHTLACWSRFGLDEDSVELQPHQPLIQAVADAGTPNLRILRQSQVMDALSTAFRVEDCPEAIVITLGAIRDMSLYRPLARQITNCGLISNLVHVIRVNLLGSDVLLVAAEVLWNVLELDWEGAAQALGQQEVIESFRDFMGAVLARGYRFKDKIFRNDMMVLLMYISKRPENRPLFATSGLMALLLMHTVSAEQRRTLKSSGVLDEMFDTAAVTTWGMIPGSAPVDSAASVPLTNSQEDMEFRTLLWSTLARCCSSDLCAEVATRLGLVPLLLSYLDVTEVPPDQRQWSQEQRRKVQLEALSALFLLVQCVPNAFLEAHGNAITLQLLQATRSREVQRKSLHLLQVAVRMGPSFPEELGRLGAVGALVELFADRDNPMSSRQLCASVLAGLCRDNPDNCREFRKKDGVEAIREEVAYQPDETTDNHLFYTVCVVDCVWCAVVGTRKNEVRFLDAGGLFALLDVLEVAPLLLKRQIIGCIADLMQYRKAAKLFVQWNSQVTMKGAIKILLELWQNEQDNAESLAHNGVIRDIYRPLNPGSRPPEPKGFSMRPDSRGSESSLGGTSRASDKLRAARSFAETASRSARTAAPFPSPGRGDAGRGRDAMAHGAEVAEDQDCRAKIFAILAAIGFECSEALNIAERQHMELVKLYPQAVELETWINVKESLERKGLKPIGADRKWIEDSIAEGQQQTSWVCSLQQNLADEKRKEEEASLQRFYEDIRTRAQFRRTAGGKETGGRAMSGGEGLDDEDVTALPDE
eukprot:TRINITY_DN6586_c0_g1_i1.p1 TRINITY_DN6586_c0_g1~~TRINITY_DN6586_c0_g1_i1.p1  ORF type:complete len:923 (+),score=239.58 TRINITY_DN6586_c0_g1_i1:85-2853(+)